MSDPRERLRERPLYIHRVECSVCRAEYVATLDPVASWGTNQYQHEILSTALAAAGWLLVQAEDGVARYCAECASVVADASRPRVREAMARRRALARIAGSGGDVE